MKYYDISVPISATMPIYEGDPPVEVVPFSRISRGDIVNVLRLNMGTHTGTHIDAPLHVIEGGRNISEIPIETLHGPALIIDTGAAEVITPDFVASPHLNGIKRILFKTRNSSYWKQPGFRRDFTYLTGETAKQLADRGVKLVGIDYLSIEKFGSEDHAAHRLLLEAGVVVLEGLNLSDVSAGIYELLCLPLRIHDGDGSPCRAILLEK